MDNFLTAIDFDKSTWFGVKTNIILVYPQKWQLLYDARLRLFNY